MDAILLAAGKSQRMGPGAAKQLVRLGGKPMMIFSLEKLLTHSAIGRAIVVCPPGHCEEYASVISEYRLSPCTFVEGGSTRQESVYRGLKEVRSARVLVHEAARPLISLELISRVAAHDDPAVVPVVEIPFTVSVGTDHMTAELDRNLLVNIQLPQVFDSTTLRHAHEVARESSSSATEDSMLVFRLGQTVRFVRGEVENIKVTWPIDVLVAREYLFGDWQTW